MALKSVSAGLLEELRLTLKKRPRLKFWTQGVRTNWSIAFWTPLTNRNRLRTSIFAIESSQKWSIFLWIGEIISLSLKTLWSKWSSPNHLVLMQSLRTGFSTSHLNHLDSISFTRNGSRTPTIRTDFSKNYQIPKKKDSTLGCQSF